MCKNFRAHREFLLVVLYSDCLRKNSRLAVRLRKYPKRKTVLAEVEAVAIDTQPAADVNQSGNSKFWSWSFINFYSIYIRIIFELSRYFSKLFSAFFSITCNNKTVCIWSR